MVLNVAGILVKLQTPCGFIPRHSFLETIISDYGAAPNILCDFNVKVEDSWKEHLNSASLPMQGIKICNPDEFNTIIYSSVSISTIRWRERIASISFFKNAENPSVFIINLLKVVFSFLVLEKGGLPLHSSAVFKGNEALVFFGPSEAGKSTIAGLLEPEWKLLNDEVNFILPHNGLLRVHSTPFASQINYDKSTKNSASLRRLFSLEKSPGNKTNNLPNSQKLFLLLGSTYTMPLNDSLCQLIFKNTAEVCKAVSIQKLFFKNDKSILRDITSFIN